MLSTEEESLGPQSLLSREWKSRLPCWLTQPAVGEENTPSYLLLLGYRKLPLVGGFSPESPLSLLVPHLEGKKAFHPGSLLGKEKSLYSFFTDCLLTGQQSRVSGPVRALCYHSVTNLPSIFQSPCFGLNVCAFPKFICSSPNSQCDGIWKCDGIWEAIMLTSGHGGGASLMGLVPLYN